MRSEFLLHTWNMSTTHAKMCIDCTSWCSICLYVFISPFEFFFLWCGCRLSALPSVYPNKATRVTHNMVFVGNKLLIEIEKNEIFNGCVFFYFDNSRKEMAFINTTRSSSVCWRSWTASGDPHDRTSKLQVSTTSQKAYKIPNWIGQLKSSNHQ